MTDDIITIVAVVREETDAFLISRLVIYLLSYCRLCTHCNTRDLGNSMGKKTVYTKITPLPPNVPRQLAIELLHSHEEVAKLNPLVTGVKAIDAPRDCPNEEYFSQWYEISEIITWGFGMKKKIAFKGVFHDQPWGMQSHVYAPMGVDLRNKYRIGGNQPGEPREPKELGVDTPLDGLYLREDVEIVCNFALASYVKKETKEATGKMIERLARKAELLDEGKLHAMFENGMLKTAKPSHFTDDSHDSRQDSSSVGMNSPPSSPAPSVTSFGPRLDQRGYGKYHDVARTNSLSAQNRPGYIPSYQQSGYNGPEGSRPHPSPSMPMINELPGDFYQQGLAPQALKPQGQSSRSELPGDTSFSNGIPSPQPSPGHPPADLKSEYQAYPPPRQQHPTERNFSRPSQSPRLRQQPSSEGSAGGDIQAWQNGVATSTSTSNPQSLDQRSSQGDTHSSYAESSRRTSNNGPAPDHRRFSQMSVQSTPPTSHARTSIGSSYTQSNAGAGSSAPVAVKCPVCGLFEGDEQAVSHHVSKAHFT